MKAAGAREPRLVVVLALLLEPGHDHGFDVDVVNGGMWQNWMKVTMASALWGLGRDRLS
jgi:hypothetical protein